jgi:uncharacterized protein (DUF433 family)
MSRNDELIHRYIKPDAETGRPDNARIVDVGVPVWALIGYLKANDHSVERTAAAYHLPPDAVDAARAYYDEHRAVIDARLALQAA